MKPVSVVSVLALALAGAACASPSEEAEATPQEAPVVEASAEDSGFNLMIPGEDDGGSDDGWNLGVDTDGTEDGFVIPDGVVADRLGDVAELPTGEDASPDLSADIPVIREAEDEDDLIRLD